MTINVCATVEGCVQLPSPGELCAKGSEVRDALISAVPAAGPKMPGWKAVAFAGGLVLALHSAPLHAAVAGGSGTVQGLYDALLSMMKSGGTLGGSGRFAKLAPVIRSSFDVDLPGVTGIYLDQSEIRA